MDEFPIQTIPTDAHWSENFALAGYDPESGIDIFLHIGRWRRDLSLWRELVTVALPDGNCVVHRAIGNARSSAAGPGGPCLAVTISQPGPRMEWSFLGGARHLPSNHLRHSIVADGPLERLEFNLVFESGRPLWDLSQAGHRSEFMGRGHVEQIGNLTGNISVGTVVFGFNGLVNRDHSRGPRLLDTNRRHIWMHGTFSDGMSFQLYEAEIIGREAPAYSEVAVIRDNQLYRGKLTLGFRLPFENNWDSVRCQIPFSIEYDGGLIEARLVEFPTILYFHSTSPNDLYVGVRQIGDKQSCSYIEQSATFELSDGTRGHGHVERLVPGRIDHRPAVARSHPWIKNWPSKCLS